MPLRGSRLGSRWALVALLALALVAGCGGEDGGRLSGPGFAAELPDDWKEGGLGEDLAAAAAEQQFGGVEVVAVATRDDADDGFRSNVNVNTVEPATGASLTEVVGEARTGLVQGYGLDEDKIEISDVGEPVRLTLAGEPAESFDYMNEVPQGELQQRIVMTIHDGRVYSITFSAGADAFEEQVEEFDEILAAWRWTSAAPR